MNSATTPKFNSPKTNAMTLWNPAYLILFAINILVSMTLYMTNTSMAGYLTTKGFTATLIGTILGMMSIASMVTRPFSGIICDRMKHKKLMAMFLAMNACVMFGYGFFVSEWVFMSLRILHGVAFGMTTTILMTYVTTFIPENHIAQGMGYFGLGQSIAAAIGPPAGLWLSQHFGGTVSFAAAGILLTLALILVVAFLPEQDKVRLTSKESPPIRWSSFIAREAIPFAIITIALSATNGIETGYIAIYGQSLGLGNVGWYFTVTAAVLFLSRLLLGRVTDLKGFRAAMYPGVVLIMLAFLLLALASRMPDPWVFVIAACLKASGVGLLQPAIQSMCIRSVEPARRGSASGTYYIGTDLGQGSSTLIAGTLIPISGYSGVFFFFMIPLVLVAIFYAVYSRYKRNQR